MENTREAEVCAQQDAGRVKGYKETGAAPGFTRAGL